MGAYLVLSDGTRIDNVLNYAEILVNETINPRILASSYENAGYIRSLFTNENTSIIKHYSGLSDEPERVITGAKLLEGCHISGSGNIYYVDVAFTAKSEIDIINEQLAEIQEYIIG